MGCWISLAKARVEIIKNVVNLIISKIKTLEMESSVDNRVFSPALVLSLV